MILSQRYPTAFNGIVSGDPAMRDGLSNPSIGQWIPVAYNQAAPKDTSGRPQIDEVLTDSDRTLFTTAALFWGRREVADLLGGYAVSPDNLRAAAGKGMAEMADGFLTPMARSRQRPAPRWFYRPHVGFPDWQPSTDQQ